MRLVLRLRRCPLHFPLVLLGAVFVGTTASASPKYTIRDLGTLPGTTHSAATAINNQGQVVGVSYNADDGTFEYGNSFGIFRPGLASSTLAPGFRSRGGGQSFLYQNGVMSQTTALGGLARDINDRGQIIGGESHTAINNAGQYVSQSHRDIGSYTGASADPQSTQMHNAFDINNQGIVVGATWSSQPGWTYKGDTVSVTHASVLRDGELTYLYSFPDPNLRQSASYGQAVAVNDQNQVLVNIFDTTFTQNMIYLYSLDERVGMFNQLKRVEISMAKAHQESRFGTALNNNGEVVGNDFLYDGSTIHKLTELLTSPGGWSSLNAMDINDQGWIVGQGTIDGELRAFLMTPVPEPSTVLTWAAIAAAGLGWKARRNRNRSDRSRL